MSSTNLQRSVYDPTIPPPTPFIYPRPRRVILGTEEHKVRVSSMLLPDPPNISPFPPNNDIYIPRLNGGRQLYVEQQEPAWMTGAHGQLKPAKTNFQKVDWRNEHPALRAQRLSRSTNESTSKRPETNSNVIEMDPKAFEQDYAKLTYAPVVIPRRMVGGGSGVTFWPRAIVGDDDAIEMIGPSVMRSPVIVHEAGVNQRMKSVAGEISALRENVQRIPVMVREADTNQRMVNGEGEICPFQGNVQRIPVMVHEAGINQKIMSVAGEICPFQGNVQFAGDGSKPYVFPIRKPGYQPTVSRYPRTVEVPQPKQATYAEAFAATYATLVGNVGERSPSRASIDLSQLEASREVNEPIADAAIARGFSFKKGSRMMIFGKQVNFLDGWGKKPKTINLKEKNIENAPKHKHYEGCILCTPPPSPNSSVTESQVELYAPSKQNSGPPPFTPPPSPKGKGIAKAAATPKPDCPRDSLFGLAEYNPARNLAQFEGGIGEPGPSDWWAQGLSAIKSQPPPKDYGPYNTPSESFYHGYNGFNNVLDWPLGNSRGRADSLDWAFIKTESEDPPNLSPSGSIELLTGVKGFTGGGKNYPGGSRKEAEDSNNPNNIRATLGKQASFFNRGPPTPDLEMGVKRLPLSNSPIFPGRKGIMRLPDDDFPHPGVRKDHQAIGAEGVYEMVDLGAPVAAQLGFEGEDGRDTRAMWERMKGEMVKAIDGVRNFLGWAFCI